MCIYTYIDWGYIGIMEKKMDITTLYRAMLGYIGMLPPIMDKQMEKNMDNEMEAIGV